MALDAATKAQIVTDTSSQRAIPGLRKYRSLCLQQTLSNCSLTLRIMLRITTHDVV